ncbi:MAG: arsenate reductase ArsC [Chloroflexi bacterium]|nr:arsenate reductase ArsC [Chloroflexota bacterium]
MIYKVLFLCTGNSCRSQIAEAIVNRDLSLKWQAFSAGTAPSGQVHPMVIQVLKEIGIDHKGTSKSADVFSAQVFDLVITVCDDAAQNCPAWLGRGRKVHIGFEDPAKFEGTEEEILRQFRLARDEIQSKVTTYLTAFEQHPDKNV